MYVEPQWRTAQYFVCPEWTGGIYASPTMSGSRPGALIAGCWATMMHLGRNGYVAAARRILDAARIVADAIRASDAVTLFGEPNLSVVCFGPRGRDSPNIYHINDAMASRGWHLNVLQYPTCLHLCVTYANASRATDFASDLSASVAEVRAAPPGRFKDGSSAVYGAAVSIPDKSMVADTATYFLDALYVIPRGAAT